MAEVEDYVRVDVLSESRDLVTGNAVNDVIHLVAELVENATVFSPPNTRIEVRADRAGTGLVAEIEDRGLGLNQEELADINIRLANPPEFDLANSEQLGLFVVSRLAARHSIKVSLRQSVYGGTTAILVLPFGVIVREEEAGTLASQGGWPADGQQPGGVILPPDARRSVSATSGPMPAFGVTGGTGCPRPRRAGGSAPKVRAATRKSGPRRCRPFPRAPWEYTQEEPPGQVASAPTAPTENAENGEKPPWDAEAGTSWFDPFSRTSARREPDRPGEDTPVSAPAVQHSQRAVAGVASSGSHLGMPIRVPQASLAPQLRAGANGGQQAEGQQAEGQQAEGGTAPDVGARSPEATRNLMIMMQQGWERGRVDDLDDPAGISDNGAE